MSNDLEAQVNSLRKLPASFLAFIQEAGEGAACVRRVGSAAEIL